MSEELAIVHPADAEAASALAKIVGTADVAATMAHVERIAQDVVDLARDRGFVHRFGDSGAEFYMLPAWQLLGSVYGVLPFVEWSRRLENGTGWEARAVARTLDGRTLAAAEAGCSRDEPNHRRATDHALRAMAQRRAERNALRGALGFALVLAGFDFANPEAPATRKQVGALHGLAKDRGWSHAESHSRAGVESFNDLTREQAAELIDAWSDATEEATETQRATASDPASEHEEPEPPAPVHLRSELEELRITALERFDGSRVKVLRAVLERHPREWGTSFENITAQELRELLGDGSEELAGTLPLSDPGGDRHGPA